MESWSLTKLVLSMFATPTSTFFFFLLISYFVIALLHRRGIGSSSLMAGVSRTAVAALPTIGVLGTFYGIAIGLLDFDVANIDDSVPALLAGLKISFLTSILGIALSVVLRLIDHYGPVETSSAGATIEDLHQALVRVAEENRQIREAVGGDGDNTAVTQLKNLRTDFRDFANKMAEDSTAKLVEALAEVMRDFNAKINEQFGDNFKQLNEAVGAMLIWQQQYREQVQTLTDRFDQAGKSIDHIRTSANEIATAMSPMPGIMGQLAEVVKSLDYETDELERKLEAFAAMSTDARDAFPTIQKNIDDLYS